MVTEALDLKITYTTMSVEQSEIFNAAYDEALARVLASIGRTYPAYVAGDAVTAQPDPFESRSPNDTGMLLGRFQECGATEVDRAVAAARKAFTPWSHLAWQERLALLRRARDIFKTRKYDLAAWITLEAGKPRIEAMGEVEEAIDLITVYGDQLEQHDGYRLKLGQLSPQESNYSVLRPYGVFGVISPFNFPVALSTGMIAAALMAGNTVVFKPSIDTPLAGVLVYECLTAAGLPDGVLNLVTGSGNETGEAITGNKGVDGIAFIGSAAVGTHIAREFSRRRPRPVIAEMGGKNATIVSDRADMAKAVEGTVRAAYGYSGQKCSATSRVYVHRAVADDFLHRLVARTEELVTGDPSRADVFVGPVINEKAYQRFRDASTTAASDGTVLTGGTIVDDARTPPGYYCRPTIAELPSDHRFFKDELFIPFVSVTRVDSVEEAIRLANDSEYGLTGGIFTEDEREAQMFLDRIEVGVAYVNRKSGSTTGAWPGIQSFGGWKSSGSTGKSALGPYYVAQFMREQTQTVVSD